MSPALLALVSVIIVSLVSFVGIVLFVTTEAAVRRGILALVSFSTGAMLGDVFIHMLPEMAEEDPDRFPQALFIVLVGIVASFAVEKLIHWRHCHLMPGSQDDHDHCHSAGLMTLFGDGVHNFIDGAIIGVAYLVSVPIGVSTTIAVILHEIPQEIGNFAVLVHDGYPRGRALFYNFLSALMAVVGTLVILFLRLPSENLVGLLLPFAAGNFVYIAGADLIPELHRESRLSQAVVQLIAMMLGIGAMYVLLGLE
ncbi:MAG: zinc/iron permease [Candidatus Peregrinibacteria bacterium Greene0416_19]|nr:MAG: zinc/iron permease [Candidatus Peregrinibacteria bacterium Greene0416_19]